MDNLPLKGSGWVDMSSQMVLLYRNLSFMCKETGNESDAGLFEKNANEISHRINSFMWNENDGFYFNVDDEGKQQKVKSAAGFWTLIAGIANKNQAEKLLDHLKDTKSFWRAIPFPSLAADEKEYRSDGQYWLGGVWASTNVMIIKGLEQFGKENGQSTAYSFNEFATRATEKYLDGLFSVYKKTGTLWENYSPDLMMRGNPSQKNFVGWTGCGPIELLIENILGIHPDGANNRIVWNISRIDRHGIEQLKFGDVTATLICQKRESISTKIEIHIIASKPFNLVVVGNNNEQHLLKAVKGVQKFVIE